jgi:hypothetical protein
VIVRIVSKDEIEMIHGRKVEHVNAGAFGALSRNFQRLQQMIVEHYYLSIRLFEAELTATGVRALCSMETA